ncbi:hypothetical protein FD723_40520 (plasmid) [Nostoc sp. C052]|uniref:hypothetical protein n=1 Tax=Nostoc sp. C052 TaxID=2576902 RepID=UPI0015C31EAF|nr:hypothetical protein [Nostoc sp. C052]QLE46499.1 hypothetical protein FD723_40520 [Nostoc sp. C052]
MQITTFQLPEKHHYRYQGLSSTGKHRWEDKNSEFVRISSPLTNPWNEQQVLIVLNPLKTKGLKHRTIIGLKIWVFPLEKSDIYPMPCHIERTILAARCAYSPNPNLLHFAIKSIDAEPDRNLAERWLEYTIYPDFKRFKPDDEALFYRTFAGGI